MARASADLEQALAHAGYRVMGDGTRGATATVYPARTETGLAVAVKVLNPDTDLYTLQREASILASIDHPGIIAIVDYGRLDTGELYLTSRWVDGTTMAKRLLADHVPPSMDEARHIIVQLADALDHVHGAGIVHRDLSPANILIGPDDRLTLIDFGISRTGDDGTTTAGAELIGTTRYMAPELIAGAEPTPASDQYAAAVLLYELIAGHWPYDESATVANVFHQHLHSAPVPLSERVPTADAGVEGALERALAKEPTDRFPTMGAFADAALAEPERPAAGRARTAHRDPSRRALLFAGAGAVALAAIVGGGLLLSAGAGDDEDGGQAAVDGTTDGPIDETADDAVDATADATAEGGDGTEPVDDGVGDSAAPGPEPEPETIEVEIGDSTPVASDWPSGLASELECNLIADIPGFEGEAVPKNYYLNPTEPDREDRVRLVPGSGEEGSTALAVGIDGGFGLFGHIIEVEPDRRYVFSASVAVAGQPTVTEFGVEWLDAEFDLLSLTPTVADPSVGAPGRVTMTTPPAPADAAYAVTRVYKDASSGVLLIDELVFTPADAGCVDLFPPSN